MKSRREIIEEYKKQFEELKQLREFKKNVEIEKLDGSNNSSKGAISKVKSLGSHPILGQSSKHLFVSDEKGYLQAVLLGGLVFTFEVLFLLANYFIFKN